MSAHSRNTIIIILFQPVADMEGAGAGGDVEELVGQDCGHYMLCAVGLFAFYFILFYYYLFYCI